MRLGTRPLFFVAALALLCGIARPAQAQTYNNGFQMNRYEPTAAGEWSFWVDHPWYSSTRYFAAGLTLNYGHSPLVFGQRQPDGSFQEGETVIAHQLLGHIDLAGSFLDRVNVSLSLPITFLERGTDVAIAGVRPKDGGGFGDPRIGGMVRIWKQPDADPISVSAGAFLWIPVRAIGDSGAFSATTGEQGVRFMPKVALGGVWKWLRWSATVAFYYRPEATIGNLDNLAGSKTGSEIQLGASAYYYDKVRRFAVGPELLFAGQVIGTEGQVRDHASLELLVGGHYNIAKMIQVGAAVGGGALRQPGTPDARFLLRLAYAPIRQACKDTDGDSICDSDDACPMIRGIRTGDRHTHGCPPGDRDGDGIIDVDDICPDVHMGAQPDLARRGCPLPDRDGDGIVDTLDLCPDVHMGPTPDPTRAGCPFGDRDADGIPDNNDACPDTHKGPRPDPANVGCPLGDRDRDGVLDPDDKCPDEAAGFYPDPDRLGCPQRDRDKDGVPDHVDACPDKPGAPHPDPKKHGCPGLVTMTAGEIKILKPVFFATDQDVILPQSFPVLQAVAAVLKGTPQIKKIVVEGHTDNRGDYNHNMDLSERRARSVVRYLMNQGIPAPRLAAQGFGPQRPIRENTTQPGRAANRRVEFHVADPSGAHGVQEASPADVASPDTTDTAPGRKQ